MFYAKIKIKKKQGGFYAEDAETKKQ